MQDAQYSDKNSLHCIIDKRNQTEKTVLSHVSIVVYCLHAAPLTFHLIKYFIFTTISSHLAKCTQLCNSPVACSMSTVLSDIDIQKHGAS